MEGAGSGEAPSGHRGNSKLPSFEQLSTCFHMPSKEACAELGVGLAVLRRACRRYGLTRWPYRSQRRGATPQTGTEETEGSSSSLSSSSSKPSRPAKKRRATAAVTQPSPAAVAVTPTSPQFWPQPATATPTLTQGGSPALTQFHNLQLAAALLSAARSMQQQQPARLDAAAVAQQQQEQQEQQRQQWEGQQVQDPGQGSEGPAGTAAVARGEQVIGGTPLEALLMAGQAAAAGLAGGFNAPTPSPEAAAGATPVHSPTERQPSEQRRPGEPQQQQPTQQQQQLLPQPPAQQHQAGLLHAPQLMEHLATWQGLGLLPQGPGATPEAMLRSLTVLLSLEPWVLQLLHRLHHGGGEQGPPGPAASPAVSSPQALPRLAQQLVEVPGLAGALLAAMTALEQGRSPNT